MPAGLDDADLGTAAMLLIFAYGGYEVTGVPAGEASNPRRDVPFAFVMTIVTCRPRDVADLDRGDRHSAGRRRDAHAAGRWRRRSSWVPPARPDLSIGSVLSMTGNNMGQVLTGSRTIFALAENGDLPRWFAHVHPVHRTPVERDSLRARPSPSSWR